MDGFDRILGCLQAAAVGDAMGAATEIRSREAIFEKFGLVEEFVPIPDDTFLRGCPSGLVTDDFSLAFYTARAIIKHGGVCDEAARDALIEWSKTEYYAFAGPSTKRAVDALKGIPFPPSPAAYLFADNSRATNGSAMKIAPVGLCNIGKPERAALDSIVINRPTHNNDISLAAGSAAAAAVAAAAGGADIKEVIDAAIAGAALGYGFGVHLAGPSVTKRIRLAYEIALSHKGRVHDAARELSQIIGSGLMAAEAVPTALGLFVAADGDPRETIIGAVNIGDDTDTVATIAGAVAGAYSGANRLPYEWIERVERLNGFDLSECARGLFELQKL